MLALDPPHLFRKGPGAELYNTEAKPAADGLSALPKEILYRQVYASFQHDDSAVAAYTSMGYRNVLWGSDYPHLEGTYGHSQKTLHELFDGVDPRVSRRVRLGAFEELFPHVPQPPG